MPLAALLLGCAPGGAILVHRAVPAVQPIASPRPRVVVEGAPGTGDDPSAALFDGDIEEIALDVGPEGMASLRADPTTFVRAGFTWGDVHYYPVGLRLKGQGSFQPVDDKPSLKIHFSEYQDLEFLGLERLTLNNMTSDPSMSHEVVAYWLYRQAGVPAVRAGHAWVTLNGQPYGLYTLMDDVDATFAKGWYPEPLGTMWEMDDADFEDYYIPAFQLEFGEEDRAPLQAVADGIALGGASGWSAITAAIDADEVLREFGACSVVGQFDAYPYRYPGDDTHWYHDPSTGKLTALPHGLDETYWPWSDMSVPIGDLPVFCGGWEPCAAGWRDQVWSVWDAANAAGWYQQAELVQGRIAPYVVRDTNKGYTDDEVWAAQADMLSFIDGREAAIIEQIGPR